MSVFYVSTNVLQDAGRTFSGYSSEEWGYVPQVKDSADILAGMSGMDDVVAALERIRDRMQRGAEELSSYGRMLRKISERYQEAEYLVIENSQERTWEQ